MIVNSVCLELQDVILIKLKMSRVDQNQQNYLPMLALF